MRCNFKKKGAFVYNIIWFNKYRVIQKLGQGSSGIVYLAQHEMLHTYRAIKQMPKKQANAQWMNEVNILKILRHPNIPIVYDIEEDENYIYIIEEYIEGQSLRAYKLSQTNIDENKLLDFLIQLSEVLDFLHSLKQPILYLDLKPDNILITNSHQLKLVDFGTAKVFQKGNSVTHSYGTKGYAAPEQYGVYKEDKRSDIYGLGGILFFLATGVPYMGSKEELKNLEHTSYYSKQFIMILTKCLKYQPSDRYASVDVVRKEATYLKQTKTDVCENTPHIITVTGMIPRIGTTHISLMITAYLNQIGIPALYIEQNEARVVEQLNKCVDKYWLDKIPMARGDTKLLMQRYPKFDVFICDCGVLSNQNNTFVAKGKHFLVLGSKPWEWKLPQQGFKGTYLFNYTKPEDFVYLKEKLKDTHCVRVPFASDCLSTQTNRCVKVFLQEILNDVLEKKKQRFFFSK